MTRDKEIRIPLSGEQKDEKAKKKLRHGTKSYREAKWRQKRRELDFHNASFANPFTWIGKPGREPDCVITDPGGRVRLGVWKNQRGDNIAFSTQLTVLYWDKRARTLAATFTYDIKELFLIAKAIHKAIEWMCKEVNVPYPAALFEHSQVGFEVKYGEGDRDRVVVSSEEQIKEVVDAYILAETFNPKDYAMPTIREQFDAKRKESEQATDDAGRDRESAESGEGRAADNERGGGSDE